MAASFASHPDGRTAQVVCASQDQTVRLFRFEKPSLTRFVRWSDHVRHVEA